MDAVDLSEFLEHRPRYFVDHGAAWPLTDHGFLSTAGLLSTDDLAGTSVVVLSPPRYAAEAAVRQLQAKGSSAVCHAVSTWDADAERAVRSRWPDVRVVDVCPLCREDLRALGAVAGADEWAFVARAIEDGAVALAAHPATLQTWARLRTRSRVEMFEACLRPLVADEDWARLCRLAWLSLLSGQPVAPDAEGAVLRSSLFRHHAGGAAFIDPSFATFLAAWHGAHAVPGARRMLDVALVDVGEGFELVPELESFAAWLISMRPELMGAFSGDEAMRLTTSGVDLPDAGRAALLETLVTGHRRGRISLGYLTRTSSQRLVHPDLARQLRPLLTDEDAVLARTATLLARHAPALASDLLALVEAAETPTLVRARAVRSLLEFDDQAAIPALRALVIEQRFEDPEDRVFGSALAGLWPEHLTPEELFGALRPPRRPSFLGEYRWWLMEAEPAVAPLDGAGLVVALDWVARVSPGDFDKLPAAVLARAAADLDDADVRAAFQNAVAALLERFELPVVDFRAHREVALAAAFPVAEARRQLDQLVRARWLRLGDPEWPWKAVPESERVEASPEVPVPLEAFYDALKASERGDPEAWRAIDHWFVERGGSWMLAAIDARPEWASLSEAARLRVLDAASLFVGTADPETARWFGTGTQSDRELAAYRAWSLLAGSAPHRDELDDSVWARWCPLLIDTHLFADERHEALLRASRTRAPGAWLEALRSATDGRLPHVAGLIWGDDVAAVVRERVASSSPGQWRRPLISLGLGHNDPELRVWAEENLGLPDVLGAYLDAVDGPSGAAALMSILERPPEVAQRVIEDALSRMRPTGPLDAFETEPLARFTDWLFATYPSADDRHVSGFMGTRDSMGLLRQELVRRLELRGAHVALRELSERHPGEPQLRFARETARRVAATRAWTPLTRDELLALERPIDAPTWLQPVVGEAASRVERAIEAGIPAALSDAADEAERLGDAANALRARLLLADALATAGALEEGGRNLKRASEQAAQLGDRRLFAEAERMAGDVALHMVAYEAAELHYRAAIRAFSASAQLEREALTRAMLTALLVQVGRVDSARVEVEWLRANAAELTEAELVRQVARVSALVDTPPVEEP